MSAGPAVAPLSGSDPVTRVPGVNAARAKALARLGVATVADLLRLAPRRFEDRRETTPAAALVDGATATFVGEVHGVRTIRARGGLVIVTAAASDETGEVHARWFNQPWLARSLSGGGRFLLHGLVKASGRRFEFASPAIERLPADDGEAHPGIGRWVPVHPLTTGLSAGGCRAAVWNALASAAEIEDPVPARLLGDPALPALSGAVRSLHFPDSLEAAEAARQRLAFDELLVHELLLTRRRRVRERTAGIPFRFTPTLDRRIRKRFPFPFTRAQDRAVADVVSDLERSVPMNRLVEGDVGSGKTAVAAYACFACVANGFQAAFMAPTEVLARQHEETLSRFLDGSRVRIVSLYGALRARARREALARIAAGEADLVIGTHAVLSKDVEFARLALVVVDEQHKFGVRQRRDLVVKGPAPHCLVMTATPIPRTLAMVVYGDLDLTRIEGRPPGRGPTETWIARPSDGAAVFRRVGEALALGRQAFVVYPLVAESDRSGLKDATAGCEAWRRALPGHRVGLVHGRMKAEERDAAMDAFRRRAIDVLVATVVVEVGIDVPNATVLIVEHAERFGLSQLHQLRGRVGRGPGGGLCVLLDRSAGDSPARLEVLAETEDGFAVAEEDLRLRGGGDVFGTRQHGAPAFAAARMPDDLPLLARARTVARGLESRDPGLEAADLAALRERVLVREREIDDLARGG
jgi:ATP-dependent DNA helicase RecG